MTKQEYLSALHRIYRRVYAEHGDKNSYSAQEFQCLIDTFLEAFPVEFALDQRDFERLLPAIKNGSMPFIKQNSNIDYALFRISVIALIKCKVVSRFFNLRILLWSIKQPLQIAPK